MLIINLIFNFTLNCKILLKYFSILMFDNDISCKITQEFNFTRSWIEQHTPSTASELEENTLFSGLSPFVPLSPLSPLTLNEQYLLESLQFVLLF